MAYQQEMVPSTPSSVLEKKMLPDTLSLIVDFFVWWLSVCL